MIFFLLLINSISLKITWAFLVCSKKKTIIFIFDILLNTNTRVIAVTILYVVINLFCIKYICTCTIGQEVSAGDPGDLAGKAGTVEGATETGKAEGADPQRSTQYCQYLTAQLDRGTAVSSFSY